MTFTLSDERMKARLCPCGTTTRKMSPECGACRKRALRRIDPVRILANRKRVREWQLRFPEKRLAQRVKVYGLTLDRFRQMEVEQKGVCAICGEPPRRRARLDIDHNHRTLKVRGLLCNRCNKTLGSVDDSRVLLQRMQVYLEREDG